MSSVYSFFTRLIFAYNAAILDGWFVYNVCIHMTVNGVFPLDGPSLMHTKSTSTQH